MIEVLILGDFYPNGEFRDELVNSEPKSTFGSSFYQCIQEADLAVVNLESPVTAENVAIKKTGPSLKSSRRVLEFLRDSGFNLITLANNHIMDFGETGLSNTTEAIKSAGMNYVGVGDSHSLAKQPFIYVSRAGKRLAILNFAENEWSTTRGEYSGAAGIDPVSNNYSIKEAKLIADFVLIITHGGHENYSLPSKQFRDLLRFYVDSGADAVVNHHPHCISGYEYYNGKPIYYSVGNFLFNKPDVNLTEWNLGMAVKISFSSDKIAANHILFHQAIENKKFEILSGDEAENSLNKITKLSNIIKSDHQLIGEFELLREKSRLYYKINIEPHNSRIIQGLQNRNIIRSFWSKRKKLFLLNMLKCESHRELLIQHLEYEISNSQQ